MLFKVVVRVVVVMFQIRAYVPIEGLLGHRLCILSVGKIVLDYREFDMKMGNSMVIVEQEQDLNNDKKDSCVCH